MSLEGLNEQITLTTLGLNKIEEMRQEEQVLQQHEKDIEANKKFTYKVDVIKPHYFSLQGTGQHTTTCLPCNYTCHKNCKIPDDWRKKNARSWMKVANAEYVHVSAFGKTTRIFPT